MQSDARCPKNRGFIPGSKNRPFNCWFRYMATHAKAKALSKLQVSCIGDLGLVCSGSNNSNSNLSHRVEGFRVLLGLSVERH